jgi:hypothetical protein
VTLPIKIMRQITITHTRTLIQAVVSYGCQASTMTQSSEELAKSERKILGRVFDKSMKISKT